MLIWSQLLLIPIRDWNSEPLQPSCEFDVSQLLLIPIRDWNQLHLRLTYEDWKEVSITINPYQGLKPRSCLIWSKSFWSQLLLIPIRDWNWEGMSTEDLVCEVSITINPYQGLKRCRKNLQVFRILVSITINPYQGLKLLLLSDFTFRYQVSITINPYQGLKQVVCLPRLPLLRLNYY